MERLCTPCRIILAPCTAWKKFSTSQTDNTELAEQQAEFDKEYKLLMQDVASFHQRADKALVQWQNAPDTNTALVKLTRQFEPLAESSRDLIKQTDLIYKLAVRLIEALNFSPIVSGVTST